MQVAVHGAHVLGYRQLGDLVRETPGFAPPPHGGLALIDTRVIGTAGHGLEGKASELDVCMNPLCSGLCGWISRAGSGRLTALREFCPHFPDLPG